jgi:hypothetical protein
MGPVPQGGHGVGGGEVGLGEAERRREGAEIADLEDQIQGVPGLQLPALQHAVGEREVAVQIAEDREVESAAHPGQGITSIPGSPAGGRA